MATSFLLCVVFISEPDSGLLENRDHIFCHSWVSHLLESRDHWRSVYPLPTIWASDSNSHQWERLSCTGHLFCARYHIELSVLTTTQWGGDWHAHVTDEETWSCEKSEWSCGQQEAESGELGGLAGWEEESVCRHDQEWKEGLHQGRAPSLIPSLHSVTSEGSQGSNSAKQMRSVLRNVMWFPAFQPLMKYLRVLICLIVRSIERAVEFVPITNSTFRKIMSLGLGRIMVWRSCKKH